MQGHVHSHLSAQESLLASEGAKRGVPGGAPTSRATECCSIYSDMSMRVSASSESNRKWANALHSSVFPTLLNTQNHSNTHQSHAQYQDNIVCMSVYLYQYVIRYV